MDKSLQEQVWQRAGEVCEYCRMPQSGHVYRFEIDHITPRKHHGLTAFENLALSCVRCNSHKGSNLAGVDPDTGQHARLFHPRKDRWEEHFEWTGPVLLGRTPIARATIDVLTINHPDYVALRDSLIAEGVFPPKISP